MIVFDFDGVLVDSLSLYRNVCQQAANEQGFSDTLAANPFENLDPVTFEALGEQLGMDPTAYARRVADLMNAQEHKPKPFDGIALALEALAQTTPIAVVSASDTKVVKNILAHYHLDQHFKQIIGGDVAGDKTAKLKTLRKQEQQPIVMVGDSVSDIDAAHNSNAVAIAVSWGWQSVDKLSTRRPVRTLKTPSDLTELANEAFVEISLGVSS